MKQYDKIYVPVPEKEISEKTKALSDFFMQHPLKAIPNVIVLVPEELEKMLYFFFKGGESYGEESERKDAFAKLQSPDFKKTLSTYLQSKGIQL